MHNMITMFKALSDRNRLRIMAALTTQDELCACQITELLQVTGATASRHLAILNAAELTTSRKEGRWVYYRVADNRTTDTFDVILNWMKTEFSKSEDIKADLKAIQAITACDREDLCRKQRGEACCPV